MSAADFLFTDRQKRLLAALLLHPERSYSVAELRKIAGPGRGATSNIIDAMHNAGLVQEQRVGNQRRLSANVDHPIYPELRSICRKTFGVTEPVREALAAVPGEIDFAFIFGSVATGKERPDSDIDLFVVGGFDYLGLTESVARLEKELGREIHVNAYGRDEWRALASDTVVGSIVRGPKLMVIGNDPAAEHPESGGYRIDPTG